MKPEIYKREEEIMAPIVINNWKIKAYEVINNFTFYKTIIVSIKAAFDRIAPCSVI